jgi:hypothetical protein
MGMYSLKKAFFIVIPLLLLCSCAAPFTASNSAAVSIPAKASPAVSFPISASPAISAAPSQTEEESLTSDEEETYGEDYIEPPSVDPDADGYVIIPGSLPVLTDADRVTFNPAKVYSYLAEDNILTSYDYYYYINSAENKGGKLYITITIDICLSNVDEAYQDLKEDHSLTDDQIKDIPAFSGFVIKDGHMYASEDVWETSKDYSSFEDFVDDEEGYGDSADDSYNCTSFNPVPVSDSAGIVLFAFDEDADNGGYSNVSMERFKSYVLDKDNVGEYDDDTEFILDMLYFKYSDGEIKAIYQDSGDV